MKRFTALLIALLMLCLLVPAGVSAEEEKPLWITHFNNNTVEGSGVIFTDSYSGAGWWLHYAFAPTAEEGVYEIVDSSNGLADGSALALEIPEGGFVWAANTGNDYITLNPNDPTAVDYTSPNCSNCINDVLMSWMIGTYVKFSGLDLEAQTIPTSTADVNWYEDAYVCTATYTVCEAPGGTTEESETATSSEAEASTATSEAESSATATSEPESSVAATESTASTEDKADEEGGLGTGAIVAIIVAAVAVVVVIVIVATKKKK